MLLRAMLNTYMPVPTHSRGSSPTSLSTDSPGHHPTKLNGTTETMLALALLALLPAALADLVPREWDGEQWGCKCYHGDDCWPVEEQWSALNEAVGGNLVVHVPPEAACHDTFEGPLGTVDTFDEGACEEVNANYTDEQWS